MNTTKSYSRWCSSGVLYNLLYHVMKVTKEKCHQNTTKKNLSRSLK